MTNDSNRPVEFPMATPFVSCPSRPVLARAVRGWTFLLTDSGACYRVDRAGPVTLERLAELDGCSAVAVDGAGKLFVGLFDGMVATLNDDEWAYHSADAPVLSLTATPWGLAIGDASGRVTFRDPPGPAIAIAVVGDPVVELASFAEGALALGAAGGLWRLSPPEGGTVSITTLPANDALGRPVGLFDTGDPSRAGVYSAERLAVLGRCARSFSVGIRRFPEGIAAVVPFGRSTGAPLGQPLGLLTDAGRLWVVAADLKMVAPVVVPDALGSVIGIATGADQAILAWTSGGAAIAIGHDRLPRTLATEDVAIACAHSDQPDRVTVVHWHPDRGVRARLLRPEPAR